MGSQLALHLGGGCDRKENKRAVGSQTAHCPFLVEKRSFSRERPHTCEKNLEIGEVELEPCRLGPRDLVGQLVADHEGHREGGDSAGSQHEGVGILQGTRGLGTFRGPVGSTLKSQNRHSYIWYALESGAQGDARWFMRIQHTRTHPPFGTNFRKCMILGPNVPEMNNWLCLGNAKKVHSLSKA